MQARIEHCRLCQAGEDEVACLADEPDANGRCEIADDAPQLQGDNLLVYEVYQAARASALQVTAEDKTYAYIRPEAIAAIVRLRLIPEDQWGMILDRAQILNEIENRLRPVRKKKK